MRAATAVSTRPALSAAPVRAARLASVRVSALARPVKGGKASGGAPPARPGPPTTRTAAAPTKTAAAPSATVAVTPEVAKDLYRDMVLGREFEVCESGGRENSRG
jgi:hypothetical protein